jgi:hypothetical protein
VYGDGAKRVAKVYPTSASVPAADRKTAMREQVAYLIHNQDSQVGERNSYGTDPARSMAREHGRAV